MIVSSKFLLPVKSIGFFDPVPYSCYEWGHHWEPSCYVASLRMFRDSLKFSLKVYSTFYLLALLIKLRRKENFKKKTFQKLVRDILQSSVFLALNATLYISFTCILRYLFGNYYSWTSFAAAAITGYLLINLERKSRRGMLALYVSNLASEILFNMAAFRGIVRVVPNSQVYMFIAASAGFLSLFRMGNELNKSLRNTFRFIFGNDEEAFLEKKQHSETENDAEKLHFFKLDQPINNWLKQCHHSHETCLHSHSCIHYTLKGFARNFLLGYGVQTCLNVLQLFRGRLNFTNFAKSLLKFKTCSLGLFFGLYNALFRLCNCLLRWLFNKDLPALFGAISGAVAGVSSYFYPSTTISLYFLFKLFEVLGSKAVDEGWLPRIPFFTMHLYALSYGIIMHAAYIEPHNIRPGYWKFICGLSGDVLPLMSRRLFDIYGTKASTLYPDYFPDYDLRYVTSPDFKKLIVEAEKWKES